MQSTSRDPKVHAHPRLFEWFLGSRTRGVRQCIAGYIPRASGGHQGRAHLLDGCPGRHPQRKSSTFTITPVWMNGLQRFCGEAVAWKHLRHPNVLPLLGVTVSERRFAMVSEWMEYGNINEFIEKDKRVNRAELVCRFSILTPQSLTDVLFSWLALRTVWHICMVSRWFSEM